MNVNDLNPKQHEAVIYNKGPLLILAGAGSGKTRTLTYRVAHLIDQRVSPYKILVMTFTNKAATEMKDRISDLLGMRYPYMWIGTFHSICLRILQNEAQHLGYQQPFTIYSSSNQQTLVKQCIKELNVDKKKYGVKEILSFINKAKNKLQKPQDIHVSYASSFTKVATDIYMLYQKRLKDHNAMDFGDLIFNVVDLWQRFPDLRKHYQDRFEHILIDEYQDTNFAQYQMIKLLTYKNRNVCVVGDDDQSIYGWRGADLNNILDFEKDFPDAHVIRLEQNYRSTGNILAAANAVIKNNSFRKSKKLWTDKGDGESVVCFRSEDDRDEAYFVLSTIKELMRVEGLQHKDFAILYRTHAQSRAFEDMFVYNNLPYKIYGGLRFYERKEIQDILAYMSLCVNPNDDTRFRRVINTPKRGIGNRSVEKLTDYCLEKEISLYQGIKEVDQITSLDQGTKNKFGAFLELIQNLTELLPFFALNEIVSEIVVKSGYRTDLNNLKLKNPVDADTRLENISELENVTRQFIALNPEASLSDFLESVTLESDVDSYERSDDAVTMMTLHAAKGLEFRIVFLVGLEDGLFPHSRALFEEEEMEEERRLCYVGMTRAQERLYLTYATRRMQFGDIKYLPPSRFLEELPEGIIDHAQAHSTRPAPQRVIKPQTEIKIKHDYQVGDHLFHDTLGKGIVTKRSELMITVDFEQGGIKNLTPMFAPVHKISPDSPAESRETQKQPLPQRVNKKNEVAPPNSHDLWHIGDAVKHNKFGVGVVEDVQGEFITIAFKRVGVKILSLTYAVLSKI